MPSWTATAAVHLKIVPRPGAFVILPAVFAVGVLGPQFPIVGNGALVETVVATGNTNTVIGLERAVVLAGTEASGAAGTIEVT